MHPRRKTRTSIPVTNRLSQMLKSQLEALSPEQAMFCIRRCHQCGHTHQSLGARVQRCEQCQKTFAPFFFVPETPGFDKIATLYRPLQGFTAGWFDGPEEFDPGRSSERLESRLHS